MSFLGAIGGALASAVPTVVGSGLDYALGRMSQRQAELDTEYQMKHAIQWRVADAEKAGIHPLYAMGAQPVPGGPMQVGTNFDVAGQDVGRALSRNFDPMMRARQLAEIDLLHSQTKEADLRGDYFKSLIARESRDGSALGVPTLEHHQLDPSLTGRITVDPVRVPSTKTGKPYISAGVLPGYEERMIAPGLPALLPSTEHVVAPEMLISSMWPSVFFAWLKQNQNYYGGDWFKNFFEWRYMGRTPDITKTAPYRSQRHGGRPRDTDSWYKKKLKEINDMY